MDAVEELANFKLQLQQVEAALLGDPTNEELLKLKGDLDEIIALQQELVGDAPKATEDAPTTSYSWKVGDKVLAPSANGQKYPAVIDGISNGQAGITFIGNGMQSMARLADLAPAPIEQKKNYVFDQGKKANGGNGPKNEWKVERERRKARAQKKQERLQNVEKAREGEKNKWLNFNNKATNKGMKGLKRVTASGSAPDGPVGGVKTSTAVSSRRTTDSFRSSRGAMDSLF